MTTWVVLAFTMEILSTVSRYWQSLSVGRWRLASPSSAWWSADMCILESLASRGCCSRPVEEESRVQGPQGHHQTWMPGNIAPWVGTCLDALSHWIRHIVKWCQTTLTDVKWGTLSRCCTWTKLPFRGSAQLLQHGYQPGGCTIHSTEPSRYESATATVHTTPLERCWISCSSHLYLHPTLQVSIHPIT